MGKPFYYDYFSLGQTAPEVWHKDFFWPVSRATTTQITEDFKKFHCDLINRLGNTFEGDCLAIAYHISGKFTEVVNHYVCLQRLESGGYSIAPSKMLSLIPLLQKKTGDIEFKHNYLSVPACSQHTHFRNALNSFKFNFINGRYCCQKQVIPGSATIASAGVLTHEYARNLDNWIKIISPGYLLEENYSGSSNASPETLEIFNAVTDEFTRFAAAYTIGNFGIELPENIRKGLASFTIAYLQKVSRVYSSLQKGVSSKKIKSFLSSTAGSPYNRALGLAVIRNGGEVTGFPHGYFICHHSGSRPGFHEFSTVTRFTAYTERSIPLFKRNIEANPLPRGHSISLVSDNTMFFKDLHESWMGKSRPDKIKTVMILELSMIPEWAGYYSAEAMVNYHFYYSLCSALSRNGYKVIFKRRPKDLSWEGYNLFRDIPNVEIIYEHFEKPGVIDQCDAVIAQYGCSSTLNWSMCTNKTVIYVDAGWETWFPDVYGLMSKRCRILHCSYDERNRAVFDEKELLSILEPEQEDPDPGYVVNYLYP